MYDNDMAEELMSKVLELERLKRVKGFESTNSRANSDEEAAIADIASRGTLQSGNTARVVAEVNLNRARQFAATIIESRREILKVHPELSTPARFDDLLRDVEHAIEGVCNSTGERVAKHVHLNGLSANAVVDRAVHEAESLKASARQEIEIMKREAELQSKDPRQHVRHKDVNAFIVADKVVERLANAKSKQFDTDFLTTMCKEINSCFAGGHIVATALLMRSVLNYVPPVFGQQNFAQVVAQAERTQKASFEHFRGGPAKNR